VVGRELWRQRGALALRRDGAGFAILSARPANYDRPWSPQRVRPLTTTEPVGSNGNTTQPALRDATPKPEDIEADQ
jgi:hypothetical protein